MIQSNIAQLLRAEQKRAEKGTFKESRYIMPHFTERFMTIRIRTDLSNQYLTTHEIRFYLFGFLPTGRSLKLRENKSDVGTPYLNPWWHYRWSKKAGFIASLPELLRVAIFLRKQGVEADSPVLTILEEIIEAARTRVASTATV